MNRRDIGMQLIPLIAVDFDSLILPPDSMHKQQMLNLLSRWKWLNRKLERFTIRWHMQDPQANVAAYWLLDHGLRITVIVRRSYSLGLHSAVEAVLEQQGGYPAASVPAFYLIPDTLSIQDQAMHIRLFCNQQGAYRFFTKDTALAHCLPASVCYLVRQWDSSILRG